MAEEESVGHSDTPKSLNGFCLLQSFQNLQARLTLLGCSAFTDPTLSPVISEMELLVHGFLSDGEAFKSFGYEHLYENGYLSFEQWKAFQQDQLQRDISTLDERFIAMDDSNDFQDFEDSQDPVQLFGISSENFVAVETQPDGYLTGSSQSAQCCVAEANDIEEAQDLESSYVLELLNCEYLPTVREDSSSQSICPKEIDSVNAQNEGIPGVGASDCYWPSPFLSQVSQIWALIQKILNQLSGLAELIEFMKVISRFEEFSGLEGLGGLAELIKLIKLNEPDKLISGPEDFNKFVKQLELDDLIYLDKLDKLISRLEGLGGLGGLAELIKFIKLNELDKLISGLEDFNKFVKQLELDDLIYLNKLDKLISGLKELNKLNNELNELEDLNELNKLNELKWDKLLSAVNRGSEESVRLLLNQGTLDIDYALIKAAGAGHAAVVNFLLCYNRSTNHYSKTFWYLGYKFFNAELNLILERSESQNGEAASPPILFESLSHEMFYWDPGRMKEEADRCSRELQGLAVNDIALIEAAIAGHEEVVKILLDNGANLEGADVLYKKNAGWARGRKVPLVEAAKRGHGAVMRLLLQRGAVVSSLQPLMSPSITTKEDPTFRRLNKRFIQQYRLMTEATLDSSADFSQLGTRFKNHREAWNAGISTMRRLCNGKPPRGFQNAVAFLCISRAMSETLDSTNGCDYSSQFVEDLDRWQVLFTSKELEAYRELIHSMWGIVLSENMSKSWKASDFLTLTHFQSLLSTLIRQTNEPVNLHGPHDESLRCSQQKFLARSHQTSAEPEVDLPTENPESSDRSNPPPPESIEPKPPDIPIALEKIPLKEHIENDISAASLNVIVVGLMAGAIFAIVIIFLQCASLTSLSLSLPFC
jgi:ankyrin repeat protein